MRRPRNGPRDGALARRVIAWFRDSARPLPWRSEPRDPYRSLVSEFMLQQTQVSRVLKKFADFVARFPDVASLAAADEHDVLAAWTGLGYYRRARSLHQTARTIVAEWGGTVPGEVESLRALPGVGRYTAGAIASIVHARPEPIVDTNIARVLLRVHGRDLPLGDARTERWCWARARELVGAAAETRVARGAALFNEGLMELGATVCTARAPACERCPLADVCVARERRLAGRIPRPKPATRVRTTRHHVFVVSDRRGRVLLHRRPEGGLWPGMWQLITAESTGRRGGASVDGAPAWRERRRTRSALAFSFKTSACIVEFRVFVGGARPPASAGGVWSTPARALALPMSSPQRRIMRWLVSGESLPACVSARPPRGAVSVAARPAPPRSTRASRSSPR